MARELTIGQAVKLADINVVYTNYTTAFKNMKFDELSCNISDLSQFENTIFKIYTSCKKKYGNLLCIENHQGIKLLVEPEGLSIIKRRVYV